MVQDPYKYFRPEARDLVDQFAQGVLNLENGAPERNDVQNLLRLAHTLKGAARVVKQTEIANLAHAIEDTLSPFREHPNGVAQEHIDTVLKYLDQITSKIPALENGQASPSSSGPDVDKASRTIRTDVAEADAVLDGVTESHAMLNGLRKAVRGIGQARRLCDLTLAQASPAATLSRSTISGVGNAQAALSEELRRQLGNVEQQLGSTLEQMDRELRQLRDAAEKLRLVPLDNLVTALERTARDAARAQGKLVNFAAAGGEARVDLHVFESIQGALIQIVRNAVAHGIEPEAERVAAGKPAAGDISVQVFRRGQHMVFSCHDDGRGIDFDAIRKAAQRRGDLEGAGSTADLLHVLLRGGISTSEAVTEVSGRGIGLDVVRECLNRLGGTIDCNTVLGIGTTFELIVPSSIAAIDVLTVETIGTNNGFNIPLSVVRAAIRFTDKDIHFGPIGATIQFEKAAIAFMPLHAALNGTPWSRSQNYTAAVVTTSKGTAAFGVERLTGVRSVVVRALPQGMTTSAEIFGASLDAEGNPQPVLDPDGLVQSAYHGVTDSAASASQKREILVVDDSMTTRMLEKSILESAGYDVEVAMSGEEALDRLCGKRFDLILVDVEMPGMDGFTFITRLRADPAISNIPAILVTSRAAPDDLQRGRDVGANGHIIKSEFNQAELLDRIGTLTG